MQETNGADAASSADSSEPPASADSSITGASSPTSAAVANAASSPAPANSKRRGKKRSADGIYKKKPCGDHMKTRTERHKRPACRIAVALDQMFDSSDDEPLIPARSSLTPQPQPQLSYSPKLLHEADKLSDTHSIPTDIPLLPAVPPKKKKYKLNDDLLTEPLTSKQYNSESGETSCAVKQQLSSISDNAENIRTIEISSECGPSTSTSTSNNQEVLEMPSEAQSESMLETSNSDRTEPYDYSAVSPNSSRGSTSRSFSPLPSTSRDYQTFVKNDRLLEESLRVDEREEDDDIQIIEVPCETIVVDDIDEEVELVSYSRAPKHVPKYPSIPKLYSPTFEDIILDSFRDNFDNIDCEIVDVDNVIAENKAFFERNNRKNQPSTKEVIVQPRTVVQPHRLESPVRFLDMDSSTVTTPLLTVPEVPYVSVIELNDTIDPNKPPATAETGAGEAIVCDLSVTNPAPTTTAAAPLNSICCALTNILDHMSNILTGNNNDGDTRVNRKMNKQHLNNYANSLAVMDTVDLDEVVSNRMPAHPPISTRFDDMVATVIDDPVPRPTQTVQVMPSLEYIPTVDNFSVAQTGMYDAFGGPMLAGNILATENVQIYENVTLSNVDAIPKKNTSPQKRPSTDAHIKGSRLECPICMESLASKPIASTICGHIFCMECIKKALSVPGGKRCPTCRKVFKKGQSFHPLFL